LAWEADFLVLKSPVPPGQKPPRFSRDDIEQLGRRFLGDVERTMEITGRDLSSWLALPSFELVEQKFEAWRARRNTQEQEPAPSGLPS